MPRLRTFDNIYASLNIHHEEESARIPDSERPSSNCSVADHSIADALFEDYADGKGRLRWKRKTYAIDDAQLTEFRKMLLKDRGE